MVRKLLSFLLVAGFASAAWATGGSEASKIPGTWDEIVKSPSIIKSPTAEEARAPAIKPDGDNRIYLFPVADRFVFLFDGQGRPIIAFDLTMDYIGLKKALLGGIGIGDFTLLRAYNRLKQARNEKEFGEQFDRADDAEEFSLTPEARQAGYAFFNQLEFNESWARQHGFAGNASGGKVSGMNPADFTLADLSVPAKDQDKINGAMAQVAKVFYGEELSGEDLELFKRQFVLNWDAKNEKFDVQFDPSALSGKKQKKQKRPDIPEWVLNYMNPLDNLAYKYYLNSINNTLATLETVLGKYARVFGIVVGKAIEGLKNRADTHENELLGLLQAADKGEYDLGIPLQDIHAFIDVSTSMLYLNKLIKTQDITNGKRKRAQILAGEAIARKKILAWMDKKGMKPQLFSNDKFARVDDKDGKGFHVYNMSIGPSWISRRPLVHYSTSHPNFKTASRLWWEVVAAGLRYAAPRELYLGKWLRANIALGIDIYIPGEFWDELFQSRKYVETAYEGEIRMLGHEQLLTKYSKLPFSADELERMQTILYRQRLNPFDVPMTDENSEIAINMKKLIDFLNGGSGFNLSHQLP